MSRQPRRGGAEVALTKRLGARSTTDLLEAMFATTESPVIEQEARTKQEVDLPWQVVVHNDPINLMTYVTMVFQKVFGFNREKAEKHMLEVHQQGRSIVWSGLRERAELYVQQLHGYLLLATLERVN
jgi:ATP-dependent Clp protease adaptor protein ClpS